MSDLLHTSGQEVGLGTAQCRSRGARALRPQRVLGIIRIHVAQHFAHGAHKFVNMPVEQSQREGVIIERGPVRLTDMACVRSLGIHPT